MFGFYRLVGPVLMGARRLSAKPRSVEDGLLVSNEERFRRYLEQHGMGEAAISPARTEEQGISVAESLAGPNVRRSLPRVGGALPSLEKLARFLRDEGALDVVSVDVSRKACFTDGLVVASGRSPAHLRSLGDSLVRRLRTVDITVDGDSAGISSDRSSDWLVVDAGLTVVHFFLESTREQYKIEELWHD